MRIEPLVEQLRESCVRVMGKQPGCGFAIASEWLVTCAHVVGRQTPEGSSIELCPWDGEARWATLRRLAAGRDLALLHDPAAVGPAAALGGDLRLGAPLVCIGFPVHERLAERDPFTAEYEGETDTQDASGAKFRLLKLKAGQIDRGFSGGPLLNRETGCIVGVTRLSRDTRSDLGGWAIPIEEVVAQCQAIQIPMPPPETAQPPSVEPTPETLKRIRDLLIDLPGWDRARRRHSFVAGALGKRHRVMSEVEWEGGARQLAWDVPSACEDFPEPAASGLSPLCALLVAIPSEFGPQPERDREIAALRTLLGCPVPFRPGS